MFDGSSMNKVFRLLFIIVLLGVFTCIGLPQADSPLNVSIKIDNRILQRAQPVLVHAKIKWGSVDDAKAETLRAVSLQLTKPGTESNDCRRGECVGTTYWLPKQLEPRAGELIEFDVVLTDLYWNDVISSYFDLSQPKDLFDVIPARGVLSFDVNWFSRQFLDEA
jgi:hypothetical protein